MEEKPTLKIDRKEPLDSGPYRLKTTATVPEYLRMAADIYEERNTLYGNGYKTFGNRLQPFIGHIKIRTAEDLGRLNIVMTILGKLARYCDNFEDGGHADSLDDISVYAMMLREIDAEQNPIKGS